MTWSELKVFWLHEVLDGPEKGFSWWRLWRRTRRNAPAHYLFWFRLAEYFAASRSRALKSMSKGINNRLISRHGIEIMLGARVGVGLRLSHMQGIVIFKNVIIGRNFTIRQNTTIGTDFKSDALIHIGDNVDIGANSCVIGSGMHIGDNVNIGAMSFVNKDVPSGHNYVTRKEARIYPRESSG